MMQGRRSKIESGKAKLMVSSWQVLWTELEISTISKSNSVLKEAHTRGSGGMPLTGKMKILNFCSPEMAF